MKSIITLLLFVLPTITLASGKLTYKHEYDFEAKEYKPMLGLSVYQKIVGPLAYNTWAGVGKRLQRDNLLSSNDVWYEWKNAADITISRVTLSVGGTLELNSTDRHIDKSAFGSLSIKLW